MWFYYLRVMAGRLYTRLTSDGLRTTEIRTTSCKYVRDNATNTSANVFYIRRYGASTSQCSRLLHDDTQFLLALALADNAFFDINSPEELWSLKISLGDDHLKLL